MNYRMTSTSNFRYDGRFNVVSAVRRYCDRNLPLSLNASRTAEETAKVEGSRADAICTTFETLPLVVANFAQLRLTR